MPCTCGNSISFQECCEPLIKGRRQPETAEVLMRSRYSAYVSGDVDYIVETQAPGTRHTVDRDATEQWSRKSTWLSLEILGVEAGGATDQTGTVEFVAHYELEGEKVDHHETAEFRREDGRWYFVAGHAPKQEPFRNPAKKVRPNEPCPCGSGRKHKKCCGQL